jgi:glycosyltransferase involved in cell wall biosynthesis
MRIIYLSNDYCPHDHRFLSALAGTEHEVFYVRLQRGRRQTEDRPVPERIHQVQWAGGSGEFRWRDLPRLAGDFRRLAGEIRPDIVHAGPIQTCGLVATLAGAQPRLIMSWGFDLMQDVDRNAWWRWATRFVLRRAAYFTSDCQATRDRAVACGMDPQRTIVFPWGVDLEYFQPVAGDTGTRAYGFTLFCNRSWEPRYGVDVLARAFVKVARQREDVSLLMLGGGSQAAAIRKIFENGGVSDRVTFAGQVSQTDLPRHYHMADLYISPSHVDGSSVSLMEALACGLPCLVSDIPANKEWVTDGVNGRLFPDGNVEALAAAILRALDGRGDLAGIGRAARSTAEEKADWKKNFQKLLDIYAILTRTAGKA